MTDFFAGPVGGGALATLYGSRLYMGWANKEMPYALFPTGTYATAPDFTKYVVAETPYGEKLLLARLQAHEKKPIIECSEQDLLGECAESMREHATFTDQSLPFALLEPCLAKTPHGLFEIVKEQNDKRLLVRFPQGYVPLSELVGEAQRLYLVNPVTGVVSVYYQMLGSLPPLCNLLPGFYRTEDGIYTVDNSKNHMRKLNFIEHAAFALAEREMLKKSPASVLLVQ